eukprot:324422_1
MSVKKELLVFGYIRLHCQIHLPHDITKLFVEWIEWMDSFDTNKSHECFTFVTNRTLVKRDTKDTTMPHYTSAFGETIVCKGDIQSWIFQVGSVGFFIGIIEEEIVQTYENIEDFTDAKHRGYGISLALANKYHACGYQGHESFGYAEQFALFRFFLNNSKQLNVKMKLDLSQSNGMGLLSFIFDVPSKFCNDKISTEGQYSNIAFDNIDVNKKYRAAVCCLGSYGSIEMTLD